MDSFDRDIERFFVLDPHQETTSTRSNVARLSIHIQGRMRASKRVHRLNSSLAMAFETTFTETHGTVGTQSIRMRFEIDVVSKPTEITPSSQSIFFRPRIYSSSLCRIGWSAPCAVNVAKHLAALIVHNVYKTVSRSFRTPFCRVKTRKHSFKVKGTLNPILVEFLSGMLN